MLFQEGGVVILTSSWRWHCSPCLTYSLADLFSTSRWRWHCSPCLTYSLADLFPADWLGRLEPRHVYHPSPRIFHHLPHLGPPRPLFYPLSLSQLCFCLWGCLSFLPLHQLSPASHPLLRAALKMGQNVFSQSSQGPPGPHQGSVLLAKAQ